MNRRRRPSQQDKLAAKYTFLPPPEPEHRRVERVRILAVGEWTPSKVTDWDFLPIDLAIVGTRYKVRMFLSESPRATWKTRLLIQLLYEKVPDPWGSKIDNERRLSGTELLYLLKYAAEKRRTFYVELTLSEFDSRKHWDVRKLLMDDDRIER